MRSKVFSSEKVMVLENEINRWLKDNPFIDIVSTAVASNQFIMLYETKKAPIAEPIRESNITPSKTGIHAPHISDYYKQTKD